MRSAHWAFVLDFCAAQSERIPFEHLTSNRLSDAKHSFVCHKVVNYWMGSSYQKLAKTHDSCTPKIQPIRTITCVCNEIPAQRIQMTDLIKKTNCWFRITTDTNNKKETPTSLNYWFVRRKDRRKKTPKGKAKKKRIARVKVRINKIIITIWQNVQRKRVNRLSHVFRLFFLLNWHLTYNYSNKNMH